MVVIGTGLLIICLGAFVWAAATNDECPYKWNIDICRDCGLGDKCGGKLK